MKVILSTIGKFHTFDAARELLVHRVLSGIYSGYPAFKLKNENIPLELIHTFPYLHAPYMKVQFRDLFGNRLKQEWEYWDRVLFDLHVAKHIPACDVFSGLSGAALKTGQTVKARGGTYICDRGSSHIRFQDQILREEHERWGVPYWPIDPRIIAREEAEYELADFITVPSTFVINSFLELKVPATKLLLVPYGVDLERFTKVATPDPTRFDVLYVGTGSLQKGIPYLLQAYANIIHPRKSLTLIGGFSPVFINWLYKVQLLTEGTNIKILGHIPQHNLRDYMSRSHVLVLASVQEGLAMVQAQAMACGCPVIATKNTGAENLFTNGEEGFIVPIRNSQAITRKLQHLADHPDTREKMSIAALVKMKQMGGWSAYGNRLVSMMAECCNANRWSRANEEHAWQ